MMLCVDKKMLHESPPLDHEFGQLQTAAGKGSNGGREHPRDTQAGPVPAEDQLRHDVLTRVVRISAALNQRLAL
jgi:hypothetical protein